jgi:hypothetical protein
MKFPNDGSVGREHCWKVKLKNRMTDGRYVRKLKDLKVPKKIAEDNMSNISVFCFVFFFFF